MWSMDRGASLGNSWRSQGRDRNWWKEGGFLFDEGSAMFSFQSIRPLKAVFFVMSWFLMLAVGALEIATVDLSVSNVITFWTEEVVVSELLGNSGYVSEEFKGS